MFETTVSRLREYAANPDPLANAAGAIALVVAFNQPFYPFSRNRRLARDFERYATTVAAFFRLAMIRIMLRRLAANA